MTTAANGQAAPVNESRHYEQAEEWLEKAEEAFEDPDGYSQTYVNVLLRFAAVHAQLATAADVDREASAEVRLASCVPSGGSAFDVAVRGQR